MTRSESGPLDVGPRDYVFTFSFETYVDAARRGMMRPPDRILTSLMQHPQVGRLLVANPYRWFPRVAAGRLLDRDVKFPSGPTVSLHVPIRLRRSEARGVDDVAREFAAYDRSLRRAARRRGLDRPHVITTNPLVAGFSAFEWARNVTFFARDDWLSAPQYADRWPEIEEAYRRIAASGRAVAAVSQQIIDRIQPEGPRLVLPNGVEPTEWLGPVPTCPAWLAEIPHPRALYVGTLDQRLDIEGLTELAAARPELHIVLLGPIAELEYIRPLEAYPNVHVHDGVGRSELVASLRHADICLLAHRRTPLTEAMSPLKLYEYLAAGCPVIATDLPPVHGIDDRVLLAPAVADFAELVPAAIGLGRAGEDERRRFIQEHAWMSLHDRLIALTREGA